MKRTCLLFIFFVFVSIQSFSQNSLCDRIGVCTSVTNDTVVKRAGGAYIEIGIRGFLIPDKSDSVFESNLEKSKVCALPLYSGNGFFPGDMALVGPYVDAEKILNYTETAMKRAKMAGIKIFVLGSGKARNIPDGFDREKANMQFVGICRSIALLGGKYGVTVVIEPLRREETNYINSVREAISFVREVNHPNMCVLADFYHMYSVGEDAGALVEAGPLLRHCHIAEGAERTAPGVKGDDFTPYFKALKKIDYKGSISLECHWDNFPKEVVMAVAEMKRQIKSVENK